MGLQFLQGTKDLLFCKLRLTRLSVFTTFPDLTFLSILFPLFIYLIIHSMFGIFHFNTFDVLSIELKIYLLTLYKCVRPILLIRH